LLASFRRIWNGNRREAGGSVVVKSVKYEHKAVSRLGVNADVVDRKVDASTCVVVVIWTTGRQHQQLRDEQQRRQVDAAIERLEAERLRSGCSEFHNFHDNNSDNNVNNETKSSAPQRNSASARSATPVILGWLTDCAIH